MLPTMAGNVTPVLYVEIPASLKTQFAALAKQNGRKLVAEANRAIAAYMDTEGATASHLFNEREKKAVLYVQLTPELKARFAERALLNGRKLNVEAIIALRWYVEQQTGD